MGKKMSEEQLQTLGGKLAQMKSLEMAFDKIAEDISVEINIPIWRVHASYENISHKLVPEERDITIATKFINHQERG